MHARLRGLPAQNPDDALPIGPDEILFGFHPPSERTSPPRVPPAERLQDPGLEATRTLTRDEFTHEAARCLSCGSCFGCEQCSMFCNASCYTPIDAARPGAYFSLSLDACEECGKCVELCTCGSISRRSPRGLMRIGSVGGAVLHQGAWPPQATARLVALTSDAADTIRSVQGRIQTCFQYASSL